MWSYDPPLDLALFWVSSCCSRAHCALINHALLMNEQRVRKLLVPLHRAANKQAQAQSQSSKTRPYSVSDFIIQHPRRVKLNGRRTRRGSFLSLAWRNWAALHLDRFDHLGAWHSLLQLFVCHVPIKTLYKNICILNYRLKLIVLFSNETYLSSNPNESSQ